MRIDRLIIQNADHVLCNGPYLEDQLKDIGVKNEKLIQFGPPYQGLADQDIQNDAFIRGALDSNTCTLLYVGRIEEKKGVLDLVQACSAMLLNNDQIRLLFVGEGRYLDTLKRRVKSIGIKRRVSFLGHLSHDEVIRIMRQCDILIIPTRLALGEGWCKSAIEGLALGVPLIVPDHGAFRYLVKNNVNGILYTPDDIGDLRRKITALVSSPGERRRIGEMAKKRGTELINPEVTFIDALNMAAFGRKYRVSNTDA